MIRNQFAMHISKFAMPRNQFAMPRSRFAQTQEIITIISNNERSKHVDNTVTLNHLFPRSVGELGSGSDYASMLQITGITSVDLRYTYDTVRNR